MRLSTAKLKHLNEIQNISSSLLGNFVAYTEDFQILLFLGGYIRERERQRGWDELFFTHLQKQ